MQLQKELIGVSNSGYTFDPSTASASTLTITSTVDVTFETLFSIANITRNEWYYITPGDSTNLITDITTNVITLDLSGKTLNAADEFQIIVAVEDTTKDADLAGVKTLPQYMEYDNYSDPVELVSASDIGVTDATWEDQGTRIDARTYNILKLYVQFTVNDSTTNKLRILAYRTSDGSDTVDFIIDPSSDHEETIGDSTIDIVYSFDVTGLSFIQVQTQAGTVGATEGTVTIDYALANK